MGSARQAKVISRLTFEMGVLNTASHPMFSEILFPSVKAPVFLARNSSTRDQVNRLASRPR